MTIETHTESAPLVVRTVAMAAADLVAALPTTAPLAWVRRGNGIVGWGRAVHIRSRGPDRFDTAADRFLTLADTAIIRDEVMAPGSGLVAFGSFAFSPDSPAGGALIVPEVVLGRRGDVGWLTTITSDGSLGPVPGPGLLEDREPLGDLGSVRFSPGALDRQGWAGAVAQAVARIRAGQAEKVVLARDVHAAADDPVDPRVLLGRLAHDYPNCWTFSVDGLVGATPELLVRTERGLVTSRVLAGTIRRTGDDQANLARAAALARSSKDLEEHDYAVRSVAKALEPFCTSMNVPEAPYVLHLPNVMHLASDVTGVLASARPAFSAGAFGPCEPTSLDLAGALHPSAAVCGTPRQAAADLIDRLEGMDRGRYAGPVGWLGADGDGEWGIALRCAALDPDRRTARLFAGGGIVAASVPEDELAETDAKLLPMVQALGG